MGGFWKDAIRRVNVPLCTHCGLHSEVLSPRMQTTGDGRSNALIIAEAPGSVEDQMGRHLIGQSGSLLATRMQGNGLDLYTDFHLLNAVNCRTQTTDGRNRTPTSKEIGYCRPMVLSEIERLRPKFIIPLGKTAMESIYGDRGGKIFGDLSINKWRGRCVPDPVFKAWVIPMFHPAAALRNDRDENFQMIFDNDITNLAQWLSRPAPTFPRYDNKVRVLTEFGEVRKALEQVLDIEPEYFAFDYETTGIKPYKPGHVLHSTSFCYSLEQAYSFPYARPGFWNPRQFRVIKNLWRKIMQNPHIGKVAHNLAMEDSWTNVIVGVPVVNWRWCTMNSQHGLDSRRGTKGLKIQCFLRWGVEDYSSEVDKFLTTTREGEFNEIHRAPTMPLLKYGGLDALFTYMLFLEQCMEFRIEIPGGTPHLHANYMFLEGAKALSEATQTGFIAKQEFYEELKSKLEGEISTLISKLNDSSEVKQFRRKYRREINLGSSDDIRKIIYDILGISEDKLTTTGLGAVDKSVLGDLEYQFAKDLLELRKKIKLVDTYIAQFIRESHEDLIHPLFNLHIARSGRSSSSKPNFQNIPFRDKDGKVIRKGIFPFPGQQFGECDYGSIEVRVAAMFSLDPVLIEYINDKTTDMHRDEAQALFFLEEDMVTKMIRFHAKNGWVFPQFYMSYWKTCSKNLWQSVVESGLKLEDGETTVKEHLESKGIFDLDDFAEHCKAHEQTFWEKFHVFREYQFNANADYLRKGYVETKFGFRRGGYLNRNKIINSPIQGTAFQCLLWSLIHLNKWIKDEGLLTKIVGQIHDSIVFSLEPSERQLFLNKIEDIMCREIREVHDWINVPLEVEPELAPINKPWFDKKEFIRNDDNIWVPKPKKKKHVDIIAA